MEDQGSSQEFVLISVRNPTICNTFDEGRYVTYEIILQTNSLSFTRKQSVVQRRYSDFQWLRRTLSRTTGGDIPSIPMGRKWFGVFNEDYLNKRQVILTEFLQKIVKDTLLISHTALHLFLQTELSQRDMAKMISLTSSKGQGRSMDSLENAWKAYGVHAPRVPIRRSETEISTLQRLNDGKNSALNTSQSVPVIPQSDESSRNDMWHTLKPSSSDVFVRDGTGLNSDVNGNSEVIGSFSVDNASSRMRGNSLRRHTEDIEWNDWVVIEEVVPEIHMTLKEQLQDLEEIKNNLKPEDYTNVKWQIEDTSTPSTSSDDVPMSAFSRDDSSTSLLIKKKVSTKTRAKQRSMDKDESLTLVAGDDVCCSHSSPSPISVPSSSMSAPSSSMSAPSSSMSASSSSMSAPSSSMSAPSSSMSASSSSMSAPSSSMSAPSSSMSVSRHQKNTPSSNVNKTVLNVNEQMRNESNSSEKLSGYAQNGPSRKLVKIPGKAKGPLNNCEKLTAKTDKKETADGVTGCDNSSEKHQNTVDINKKSDIQSQNEISDAQSEVSKHDKAKEIAPQENVSEDCATAPLSDSCKTTNSAVTLLSQDFKACEDDKDQSNLNSSN